MSERLKKGGGGTAWEDLGTVEFRGKAEFGDARVAGTDETRGKQKNFSPERRVQIEKERQALAEASKVGEAAKMHDKDSFSYWAVVMPRREEIIMNHAAEGDGLAYLNEVFGGDMKETLRTIGTVDTGVVIDHFDELVKMYEGQDEKKARQQAIEMVEESFWSSEDGPYDGHSLKEYRDLLDLAKRENVRLSDKIVNDMIWRDVDVDAARGLSLLQDTEYFGQYDFVAAQAMGALLRRNKKEKLEQSLPILREMGVDKDQLADELKKGFGEMLPSMVENAEILEVMDIPMSEIINEAIRDKLDKGDGVEVLANLRNIKKAGVDISGIVHQLMENEKNIQEASAEKCLAMIEQADILEEEGVKVAGMLNRILYDNIDNYDVVRHIISKGAELMKLGVAVKSLLVEALNSGRITVGQVEELQKLGVDVDETTVGELDDLKQRIKVPEYVGKEIKSNTISAEARDEQKREWSRLIGERDNYNEPYKVFVDERWQKLNDDERMAAVEKLAESLATMYGLIMPYEIYKVPQSELGERTCGRCGHRWTHRDDASAKRFVDELGRAGIEKQWVMKAEVELSENTMDDGADLANTLAHEFWHAFQRQQTYLYASGYYEGAPVEDSRFRWTPNLAKYYAANFQNGTYCKSELSYQKYREQLVEDEAFKSGALFGANMVARASEYLSAGDGAAVRGAGDGTAVGDVAARPVGVLGRLKRKLNGLLEK